MLKNKSPKSLFIKNAMIVTMDPHYGIMQGGVVIEGDSIRDVVTGSPMNDPEVEEVLDAQGMLLIPGLINAHYHSYTNMLKGTGNDRPLEIWSLFTVAHGHSLTDEDISLAVLLGAAEMMKNGITCCLDHFPHLLRAGAALSAYEKSGMRVAFAPMMHDIPDHRMLPVKLTRPLYDQLEAVPYRSVSDMKKYYEELIVSWDGRDGRVHIVLGPNAPQRCSEEMLLMCKQISEEHHLLVHMHLLETRIQADMGERIGESGWVGFLERIGLLQPNISFAHGVWLKPVERELLKASGATIVHNPASNMMLGSGRIPLREYFDHGIRIALGTDGSNCGTQHNLFEAMRLTMMMQRVHEPDYYRWIQPKEVLEMATTGGAKALGMHRSIGRIAPGALADLVLLNTETTTFTPLVDLIGQLIHYENGTSIHSVMVGGQWTVRNGRLIAFDEKQVINRAKERLTERIKQVGPALELARALQPHFEKMYDLLDRR